MEAALVGSAMGLLDCPVCPSVKEFRGSRPGRIDLFSETGLSWKNKGDLQHFYLNQPNICYCVINLPINGGGSEVYSSHSDDQFKDASPY